MEPLSGMLHIINIIIIVGLLFVYTQNYAKLKSKYTIGLMIFALLFLAQTAMGIYFDMSMVMYSSSRAENAATLLEAVKTVGFAILLWISWD